MSRKDYEKLGLPHYAPAYFETFWGEHPEYKSKITVYVYYDCLGDKMLVSETGRTSSVFAKWCGCGWAYPKYWCTAEMGHRRKEGMIEDLRTMEMFVAGCCPPEFTDEILAAGAMVD